MRRVIYCSQASTDFAPADLVELLSVSRRNNDASGVSGMLLYSSQSFLQLLEGEDSAVQATFDRIQRDQRHGKLRILFDGPVAEPLFPQWTMGFEHADDEDLAESLDGFTPATVYPLVNPDLITNAGVAQTLFTLYAKNATR